ncbi:hypothetical protein [Pseudomonas cavernae]|uniref:hypothetical protein n=1 Tax=Pseudomonas cavernae TaxID=2320867 RepID=UPI003B75C74C
MLLSALLVLPLLSQADGTPTGNAAAYSAPADSAQAKGYGVLIISRERLEVASPCEIGLYLHDQLAARLFQGQSAAFNLPPGEVPLRLGLVGRGTCAPGILAQENQPLPIRAGEVRKYRIALGDAGFYLTPAPLNY